jgi:hypothetical protein
VSLPGVSLPGVSPPGVSLPGVSPPGVSRPRAGKQPGPEPGTFGRPPDFGHLRVIRDR